MPVITNAEQDSEDTTGRISNVHSVREHESPDLAEDLALAPALVVHAADAPDAADVACGVAAVQRMSRAGASVLALRAIHGTMLRQTAIGPAGARHGKAQKCSMCEPNSFYAAPTR